LLLELLHGYADNAERSSQPLAEVRMKASEQEAVLTRLQARRQQIQKELKQLERQIVQARLQVVTVEQRIARLIRSQRWAA
jgi:septal ring factor EnvC (AmiA/AmiB activator)